MRFLVSGEGPTDMGCCELSCPCDGENFKPGPMAWMVDQVAEEHLGYLSMELSLVRYVGETSLSAITKQLRPRKFPGRHLGTVH
jgi:hypothetical protein